MMKKPQAAECWRGEPYELFFELPVSESVDGATIVLTMAEKRGMEPFHTQPATILSPTQFVVVLSGEVTNRAPRSYWWDAWKTSPAPPRLAAIGYLTIKAVVRQPTAA